MIKNFILPSQKTGNAALDEQFRNTALWYDIDMIKMYMCGIFGFAKREGWQSDDQMHRIDDVITNLTWESVVRGQDSTGLAIVSKEEKLIYRTLQQSDELVCSNEWNGILEKVDRDTTVFMGHVRFATHGTITIQNAHPFTKGSVIGAHNGVIYNHKDIASKIGKNVQVDSEVIFGLLNKKDKYQDVFGIILGLNYY